MIQTKILTSLFTKQVEKGYKPMWVLYTYIKDTKGVVLTSADRLELVDIFNINDESLTKAIKKAKNPIDEFSYSQSNSAMFGASFCDQFGIKMGRPSYIKRRK